MRPLTSVPLMGLQSFEQRLERMVDGVFARAFRSSLRPVELGRRLVREMDDHRSVDVRGRTIVPNDFTFTLSPDDLAAFADINEALVRELCDAAREHAREEEYSFMGPVRVALDADERFKAGRFTLARTCKSRCPDPWNRPAALVLSTDRIGLGEEPITTAGCPSAASWSSTSAAATHRAARRQRVDVLRSEIHERHAGERHPDHRATPEPGRPDHAGRHRDPVRDRLGALERARATPRPAEALSPRPLVPLLPARPVGRLVGSARATAGEGARSERRDESDRGHFEQRQEGNGHQVGGDQA